MVQPFVWCRQTANDPDMNDPDIAAATDDPDILWHHHLALFYKSGIGTAEDRVAALQWFKKEAASHGHKEAENEAHELEGKPGLSTNSITNCQMF